MAEDGFYYQYNLDYLNHELMWCKGNEFQCWRLEDSDLDELIKFLGYIKESSPTHASSKELYEWLKL